MYCLWQAVLKFYDVSTVNVFPKYFLDW